MPIEQSAGQRDFLDEQVCVAHPAVEPNDAFDANAPDIVVQDGCAANFGEHAAIAAEPVAAAHVMNAFDPNHPRPVLPVLFAPITGG